LTTGTLTEAFPGPCARIIVDDRNAHAGPSSRASDAPPSSGWRVRLPYRVDRSLMMRVAHREAERNRYAAGRGASGEVVNTRTKGRPAGQADRAAGGAPGQRRDGETALAGEARLPARDRPGYGAALAPGEGEASAGIVGDGGGVSAGIGGGVTIGPSPAG